jgi:cytochrome c-type biogenesis protein CcmE
VAAPVASPKGETFGAGVKLTTTTSIDSILAEPKKFAGQTVRVEGMVTDVCPKRGCWFEMAGTKPGQKLRFKVTDGEMVFPVDSKGKKAVAEGVVSVKELSLEESKEYAEYQAKEYKLDYDPAKVTEPMSIVRIDGTGAVFVN